ncbi:hypothetical protein KIPB_005401 [Kipferlia bialata]|uniref:Uncharacterized protein n=1 Tax=Kipferlia bialata TaxID=797122 RepID=A0A391NLT1_9EUKA|nr:hypothetical protein KIPB_005401 [Kipferlia bialata]|eukprot:g5401.t1
MYVCHVTPRCDTHPVDTNDSAETGRPSADTQYQWLSELVEKGEALRRQAVAAERRRKSDKRASLSLLAQRVNEIAALEARVAELQESNIALTQSVLEAQRETANSHEYYKSQQTKAKEEFATLLELQGDLESSKAQRASERMISAIKVRDSWKRELKEARRETERLRVQVQDYEADNHKESVNVSIQHSVMGPERSHSEGAESLDSDGEQSSVAVSEESDASGESDVSDAVQGPYHTLPSSMFSLLGVSLDDSLPPYPGAEPVLPHMASRIVLLEEAVVALREEVSNMKERERERDRETR